MVRFIYLRIVYGCFQATKIQLTSCDREPMAHQAENIYYLAC